MSVINGKHVSVRRSIIEISFRFFGWGREIGWAICLSLRPSAKNDPQDLGNDPGSKAGDNGQHQVGVSRIRQFMPQLPPKHFFPPIGNRSLVSEEMGTVAAKGHDA